MTFKVEFTPEADADLDHLFHFLLGASRAWGVEAKFGPSEDRVRRACRPRAIAMGLQAGEKWTAAAKLQPTLPKPDRLLERAVAVEDAISACEAVDATRSAAHSPLSTTPYSYRRVGPRPTLRELMVPFGITGYILRLDKRTPELVLAIGARLQCAEDFQ